MLGWMKGFLSIKAKEVVDMPKHWDPSCGKGHHLVRR